jgi:hypothetical protein
MVRRRVFGIRHSAGENPTWENRLQAHAVSGG